MITEVDIGDLSMLDLFRTEVETHTAALTNGLLDLEHDPGSMTVVEALMRAAHSIKGGARIVSLEPAVRIAHTLEDCFVAVKKRQARLESEHIDALLAGVDLLNDMAETVGEGGTSAAAPASVNAAIAAIAAITADLTEDSPPQPVRKPGYGSIKTSPSEPAGEDFPKTSPKDSLGGFREDAPEISLKGSPKPPAPAASSFPSVERPTAPPPAPVAKPAMTPHGIAGRPEPERTEIFHAGHGTQAKPADAERTVRVAAARIERLMGLAGEVVVGASWYPNFARSLLRLKRGHLELASILDKLQKNLEHEERGQAPRRRAHQAAEQSRLCNEDLMRLIDELDKITSLSATLSDRLYNEMIGVRMCPFHEGVRGYPRMVRDLSRELGRKVRLEIVGGTTEVDRDILEKLDAPLTHLLSNAVAHGIEPPAERLFAGKAELGTIRMEALHQAGMLIISVSDDGRGIDLERLREKIRGERQKNPELVGGMTEIELLEFLFLPGFTTTDAVTDIAGRGVGLDVVRSVVHEVGGVVRATTTPGQGMSFHLELPLTLSVVRTFIVTIASEPYAFPLARIDRCLRVAEKDIEVVEDRQYFHLDGDNVALVNIHEVLDLDDPLVHGDPLNVVLISDRRHSYGLVVDEFVGETELVVRPLDPRLGKLKDISAAAITLDACPALIFDVEDLVHSIVALLEGKGRLSKIEPGEEDDGTPPAKRILVVEDSFIVREKERKLLETHGYAVDVAVDGMDGWNLIRTLSFDLVVSDIDMPRMNGFELIRHIKAHETLKDIPVIIVSYKAREEDRLQGLEAGADYYLPKTDFNDNRLIEAVVDLIGTP